MMDCCVWEFLPSEGRENIFLSVSISQSVVIGHVILLLGKSVIRLHFMAKWVIILFGNLH